MNLPDELTPEQHAALVACLRRFAERGRATHLAREQAERERQENASPTEPSQAGADIPETAADSNELDIEDNAPR